MDSKNLSLIEISETKLPEIDLKAVEYNLSLTPTERLNQHQFSLETVLELEKAHKKIYANSLETVLELEKAHKKLYEKPQSTS